MINSILFKVYLVPLIGVCMHFSSYQEGTFFFYEAQLGELGELGELYLEMSKEKRLGKQHGCTYNI